MRLLTTTATAEPVAMQIQSLDMLWREAETLGWLHVRTQTNFGDTAVTGYRVTLTGKRRNTKLEIERQHTTLACAIADAINEAREMGLGEPA